MNKVLIQKMNELVNLELEMSNMYLIYSSMLNFWKYTKLQIDFYKESKNEMQHASKLIERILFIGGKINYQPPKQNNILCSIIEILDFFLQKELIIQTKYREVIKCSDDLMDYGTSNILSEVLLDEEEDINSLRQQRAILESLGNAQYLQIKIDE